MIFLAVGLYALAGLIIIFLISYFSYEEVGELEGFLILLLWPALLIVSFVLDLVFYISKLGARFSHKRKRRK
jgi:hypothetical protein